MANYSRKIVADGIGYSTIIDPKFKTNKVQIMFITDLLDETASANALAIGIMGSSNSRYKNISEITAKLNSLYGANINVDIVKQGDFQKLCIGVTSIHNRYALEGEDISGEVLRILLDCVFSPNAQNWVNLTASHLNLEKKIFLILLKLKLIIKGDTLYARLRSLHLKAKTVKILLTAIRIRQNP